MAASPDLDRLGLAWHYLSLLAMFMLLNVIFFAISAGALYALNPTLIEGLGKNYFFVEIGARSSWFFELELAYFESKWTWAAYYFSKGCLLIFICSCLLLLKHLALDARRPSLEKLQWGLILVCLSLSKSVDIWLQVVEMHSVVTDFREVNPLGNFFVWGYLFCLGAIHLIVFFVLLICLGGVDSRFFGWRFRKLGVQLYTKHEGVMAANDRVREGSKKAFRSFMRNVVVVIFVVYLVVVYRYWPVAGWG